MPAARVVDLDYLRGFVIVQIVLRHAVPAYCPVGHFAKRHYLWSSASIIDADRGIGFNLNGGVRQC